MVSWRRVAVMVLVTSGALAGCSQYGDTPPGSAPGATPGAALPTAARMTPPSTSGWRVVWRDDFTSSVLDSAAWSVLDRSTFGDGNEELACLTARRANVLLAGGVLRLRAQRETPALSCGPQDTRFPDGRPYSSAMITTKGLASWTYGRFEMRARLPTCAGLSRGLWPAFWMRPEDGGDGEIDIMEAIGSGLDDSSEVGVVHQTVWRADSGPERKMSNLYQLPSGSTCDAFHIFALVWEPERMTWLVDGVPAFQVNNNATNGWLGQKFSRPFFLRLNLAVGGTFPGAPDAGSRLPAEYAIDWVQVLQQ